MYYVFENKSDSTDTKTFEVIAPLQRMKTSKAPFNSAEDILDYVLSSSLHSVSDGLVAVNESLSYQQDVGEMEEVTDEIRIEKGRIYTQTTTNFQTLKNYAVFVAAKNHIDINNYYVRIEMTQIDMPKFADRNKLNSPTGHEESLVFKSDKFTIERK
ncbi:hypothetical protein [Aquimarina hainanensis]|uniref:hypothetical protein n=1 Tax=Aquimarina hainanensis TaxID=1578017 RepID=UPI00360C9876